MLMTMDAPLPSRMYHVSVSDGVEHRREVAAMEEVFLSGGIGIAGECLGGFLPPRPGDVFLDDSNCPGIPDSSTCKDVLQDGC